MLPPVLVTILKDSARPNAVHSFFWIRIKRDIILRAAILAQEWKEEAHLTWVTRVPAFILSLIVYFLITGFNGVLAAILVFFGVSVLLKPFVDNQMEIEGHMVETSYAIEMIKRGDANHPELEGITEEGYMLREAMALATVYKQFKSWTQSDIINSMLEYKPKSDKWVKKYYDKVMRKNNKVG